MHIEYAKTTMIERIYSPEEASEALGISLRTMRKLIKSGAVRHIRIGRLVKIADSDLQSFIDTRKRGGD